MWRVAMVRFGWEQKTRWVNGRPDHFGKREEGWVPKSLAFFQLNHSIYYSQNGHWKITRTAAAYDLEVQTMEIVKTELMTVTRWHQARVGTRRLCLTFQQAHPQYLVQAQPSHLIILAIMLPHILILCCWNFYT